jgi:SAM-dependent methyltransferase
MPQDREDAARRTPTVEDFLGEPSRDLGDWRWLWDGDHRFPIRSHRGPLGRLVVALKRLLRPLVKTPQNDLWERQRTFNLILLEHLGALRDAQARDENRIAYLEALNNQGVTELMHHNDALFSRVDQKLDRARREIRDLLGSLGAALAQLEQTEQIGAQASAPSHQIETGTPVPGRAGAPSGGAKLEAQEPDLAGSPIDFERPPGGAPARPPTQTPADILSRAREEHAYLELERRYRGTEEEIAERIAAYLPYLEKATGRGSVLDLGCGRGEALALLRARGLPARGVDSSARMVALCRERGLEAEEGDLFERLAAQPESSLGAVVSFHVIEHLPAEALDRLVRLAWRALAPGGVLILETPSPLSMVVAARNFWLDPTHRRPVHPESLRLLYELAGFDPVERLDLRAFPASERLPEIDLARLPPEQHHLADRVNRLRDRLDELLFGFQDFGMVGTKPARR